VPKLLLVILRQDLDDLYINLSLEEGWGGNYSDAFQSSQLY
jgi:hypothetical protein